MASVAFLKRALREGIVKIMQFFHKSFVHVHRRASRFTRIFESAQKYNRFLYVKRIKIFSKL
jgi:hypothetical protein